MPSVTKFVESLQSANVLKVEEIRNIYMGNSRESQIRRHNLNLYLKNMKIQKPNFTSEYILANNPFFANHNFQFINEKHQKGRSATMVWECLGKYESKPLIWNIFPFYPKNRNPNKDEINFGREFLFDLLRIFPIQKIVAVGDKSQSGLKGSNLLYQSVRHPSMGGKAEFNEGIDKIMNEL